MHPVRDYFFVGSHCFSCQVKGYTDAPSFYVPFRWIENLFQLPGERLY